MAFYYKSIYKTLMQPCHNHKIPNALNKIIYNDHKNLEEKKCLLMKIL